MTASVEPEFRFALIDSSTKIRGHRALREGVCDLKVGFRPGCRFYCTRRADTVFVFLVGVDHLYQPKNINGAITLVKGLSERFCYRRDR
jgi:putative component of toxin-antitoxin plasmid stabilization module